MITYYGHRIPIANPFQQGIGRIKKDGTIEAGESTFFLETDEEEVVKQLNKLKVKYVIVDYSSADIIQGMGSFIRWATEDDNIYPSKEKLKNFEKYLNTMAVRLYFKDGGNLIFKKEVEGENIDVNIQPLSHFRLIYESNTAVSELDENKNWPSKAIKVFEYVKGATITGNIGLEQIVTLILRVKTNQGRRFFYNFGANSDENGKFSLTVPYAGIYSFFVNDGTEKELISLKVKEEDVINGNVIEI